MCVSVFGVASAKAVYSTLLGGKGCCLRNRLTTDYRNPVTSFRLNFPPNFRHRTDRPTAHVVARLHILVQVRGPVSCRPSLPSLPLKASEERVVPRPPDLPPPLCQNRLDGCLALSLLATGVWQRRRPHEAPRAVDRIVPLVIGICDGGAGFERIALPLASTTPEWDSRRL